LPAVMLEELTLVDTPGLASTSPESSEVTRQLLSENTLDAAGAADAIIFCINTPLKDAEAEAVSLFRSGRAGMRLTSGTAVAVLTKADCLTGDRRTTWKEAVALSRKLSMDHADLFAGVAPVIGLLAETARTGALRERHAQLLATLAAEWAPQTIEAVLRHEKLFCDHSGPGDAAQRMELVQLLGLFGIGALLENLQGGAPATATEMTRIALQVSGFDEISNWLRFQLGSRASAMKARAHLQILLEKAQAAREPEFYDCAQALLDRPEMFELQVFRLAGRLAAGRVKPPPGLAEQIWILLSTGLPAVSGREAAQQASEWREWAMLADSESQSAARVMVRAWQLAAQGQA